MGWRDWMGVRHVTPASDASIASKHYEPRTIEVKSALGSTTELGSFMMFGTETPATAAGAIRLYEQSSAVANPVHMIADQFQLLEPILIETGTGDIEERHPLLDRLRSPSPDFTLELFLQKLAIDYLVTGEAVVGALGNIDFPPVELQPLSPQDLTVIEGSGGYAAKWDVSGASLSGAYSGRVVKGVRRFVRDPLTELRVIKRYSTKNGSLLRGQSILYSAAKDARQNIAGGEYNLSLLRDGGRVSLVFHFEEDMADDAWEATKRRVRETYGGPDGEKIGVTSGGKMDIKQLGLTSRDMDFEKLQQMTKFALAVAYHVPIPLLTTDAMTYNNMGEAKLMLFDDAVIPLARKILGDLGAWLLPRYKLDPNQYELSFNPEKIEPLIDRRNARLKARRDLALETINEMRRELPNRPDVENGDQILVPGTMTPLDALGLELESDVAPDVKPEPAKSKAPLK